MNCIMKWKARGAILLRVPYIVNAGNVILIGENQIHKTGSVGDGPTSRIVCNFSREYLQEISGAFPEIDLFSFMSEENQPPAEQHHG